MKLFWFVAAAVDGTSEPSLYAEKTQLWHESYTVKVQIQPHERKKERKEEKPLKKKTLAKKMTYKEMYEWMYVHMYQKWRMKSF